jgi:hypothetical protein
VYWVILDGIGVIERMGRGVRVMEKTWSIRGGRSGKIERGTKRLLYKGHPTSWNRY